VFAEFGINRTGTCVCRVRNQQDGLPVFAEFGINRTGVPVFAEFGIIRNRYLSLRKSTSRSDLIVDRDFGITVLEVAHELTTEFLAR
jgi:hypothetical protein